MFNSQSITKAMTISSPTYHTWKIHGKGLHLKSKKSISNIPLLHAGVTGSKLTRETFLLSSSTLKYQKDSDSNQ